VKTGCTLSIGSLIVGIYFGFQLIAGSKSQDQYWFPFVYGVLAMFTFLNAWGIPIAVGKLMAFGRDPSSWKTGDLVVASGVIRAKLSAFHAPFSRKDVVIAEYKIRFTSLNNDSTRPPCCFGCIMTPCVVESAQGTYTVQGFPIMTEENKEVLISESAFPASIDFVTRTTFRQADDSIKTAFNELNAILQDADGDVQAHFTKQDNHFLETMQTQQQDRLQGLDPFRGYFLEEFNIGNKAEVTATGTYNADTRSIYIGGGLQNLSHSLVLGRQAATSKWPLIRAILFTLFFGVILWQVTLFANSFRN